ncbi:MAG: hypothetical protein JWP27_435 [Flaviaesturariibacter sp.]|nr:hypothetical protein [Flaviaesturariibacter sp.]
MRKSNLFLSLLLAGSALFTACHKDIPVNATVDMSDGNAYVRIVDVAPNFNSIAGIKDSFNLFIGANKINNANLTYNTFFPVGTTPLYVSIPAGNQLFRFEQNPYVKADSAAPANIYSITRKLEAGKYYSYIVTDSFKSTNPAKQMFLEDNFTPPEAGKFGIRFIHAVHNDTAVGKTVDVFSTKQKANIFTNVAAGTATGFLYFPIPTTSGGDTVILRRSGTLYEIARINAMTQSSGRVYSLLYRGTATGVLTTSSKYRGLTSYINY